MRVCAIQSSYIPWRGYLDLINSVDLFVVHDDIQYTRQDWRNRNKIKTPVGWDWLTVPVMACPTETNICEVQIAGNGWLSVHRHKLITCLGKAPHFDDALEIWENDGRQYRFLSSLNVSLLKRVCHYLEIDTRFVPSTHLMLSGKKTDRLIQMMKAVGGTTYLSGPAAKAYLDVEAMNREGIEVEWKRYDYEPYPQLHGEFNGAVTVLDLIANVGKDSINYITSR